MHNRFIISFPSLVPMCPWYVSKNMYAPLVGSDKGGRANVNRDERMNHTEYMKVLAGVPLWEREGKRWRDGGIEQLHVVEDIILNSFTALIRPLK